MQVSVVVFLQVLLSISKFSLERDFRHGLGCYWCMKTDLHLKRGQRQNQSKACLLLANFRSASLFPSAAHLIHANKVARAQSRTANDPLFAMNSADRNAV